LEQVGTEQNKLEGILPDSIENLSKNLKYLFAYENHIIGNIPSSVGNSSDLIKLNINQNKQIGTIPSALTRLNKLQSMDEPSLQ